MSTLKEAEMREITYLQAINEAVDEEMARDPQVLLMGEDVRNWGAPYGEFKGLFEKYGSKRILDTPISEKAIMGAAIGAAETGLRPVTNIMFSDFLAVCMAEILHPLCKLRYTTGGMVKIPVTIMSYSGAGTSSAGEHSSCLDGLFMSIPGLKIAVPSTPYDAKGLLKSAIREDNPVLFLYHRVVMLSGIKDKVPVEEYTVPFGKANIKTRGTDVTIVATALMVHRALSIVHKLQEEGVSLEIIDPRTVAPLDKQAIIDSVKKTGRLIIMAEEPKTGNSAAEIAALVAEEAFGYLKAPIKRVCAPNTPIPFSPILERAWMPDEKDLIKTATEIVKH
jgi:pyruvate dehydrogenase E1 component beta subunit